MQGGRGHRKAKERRGRPAFVRVAKSTLEVEKALAGERRVGTHKQWRTSASFASFASFAAIDGRRLAFEPQAPAWDVPSRPSGGFRGVEFGRAQRRGGALCSC